MIFRVMKSDTKPNESLKRDAGKARRAPQLKRY